MQLLVSNSSIAAATNATTCVMLESRTMCTWAQFTYVGEARTTQSWKFSRELQQGLETAKFSTVNDSVCHFSINPIVFLVPLYPICLLEARIPLLLCLSRRTQELQTLSQQQQHYVLLTWTFGKLGISSSCQLPRVPWLVSPCWLTMVHPWA